MMCVQPPLDIECVRVFWDVMLLFYRTHRRSCGYLQEACKHVQKFEKPFHLLDREPLCHQNLIAVFLLLVYLGYNL